MADFVRSTWVNKSDPLYNPASDPHLTADQLNRIEAGLLDVVQRLKTGTLAARPTASATSKFWAYFATDDNGGTLYINFDGATWTKIAPGVSQAGGGGSTWAYDGEVTGQSFVDVTGLVGDTDIEYEVLLDGVVTTGGVARNITLRPNNIVANTFSLYEYVSRAGAAAAPTSGVYDGSGLLIGFTGTTNSIVASRGVFFAKTTLGARKWLGSCVGSQSTTNAALCDVAGRWEDTTTAVTSLRIDFGGGTFTGRVRVRKV